MPAILRTMLPFRPAGYPKQAVLSWQYLTPRLALFLAGLFAIDYMLGMSVKKSTKHSLETVVGAPVEVDSARAYLVSNQVLMGGVRVVNPDSPSEPVVQAECCQLDFASSPLLQRSTAIAACTVTGLKIDPRALKSSGSVAKLHDGSNDRAAAWLAQVESRLGQDFIAELPSVQATRALAERIASQCEKHDTALRQLEHQSNKLQRAAKDATANPLRYAEAQRETRSKLTALRGQYDELTKEMESLPASLEADRRTIVAARAEDEAQLRQRLVTQPIDDDAFNAYLLRDEATAPLNELIGWFRWMRQMAAPNVHNAAAEPREVLIRAFHLQGAASFAGQPVDFRGTITNLARGQVRQLEPVQLRFVTTGPQPIEVVATLDRRGPEPSDELAITCNQWKLPALTLGRAEQLTLSVAPSSGTLSINLRAVGDELSGQIAVEQSGARVTPQVHGALSVLPLVSVAESNSFSTRIAVQGTVESPAFTPECSLSPSLAKALEESLKTAIDGRVQTILATARQRVDERLAELDRQIASEQTALMVRVQTLTNDVERIADGSTPRDRISIERIGHRLPETSRFR